MRKATIVFRDLYKNNSTMKFESDGEQLTAETIETLKGVLASSSECDVASQSLIVPVRYTVAGAGNRDHKAILVAQETANGHVHKWALPGYVGVTEQDNEGDKLPEATATTLIAAIATATGLTLAPLRCPVITTR